MFIHKRIKELIYGIKRYIALKSLVGILICLTYIMQAVFLGKLIGQLYQRKGLEQILKNVLILLVIVLVRLIFIWFNNVCGKWMVGRVKDTLRKRAYKKLLKLGVGFMSDKRTGNIESVIVAGVDYLEGYLTLYIPQIIVCIIISGGISLYIGFHNIVLGILVFFTVIVALYAPMFFVNVLSKFTQEHWQAYTDLNAEFVDSIQGMFTLKAFNAAGRIGEKLKFKMHNLFIKTMKSLRLNLAEVGVSGFSTSLGSAFTIGLAAYYTVQGKLTLTYLAVLLFLVNEVYRPVTELSNYFHQGFMGMTSADAVMELLDTEEKVKDSGKNISKTFENTPISVSFENISFSYSKDTEPLFNNFSLNVKAGEKLALAGESGSGKSTLISLLLRFYEVEQGKISCNNVNVKDISLKTLCSLMSVVSQDTYLFHGSIRDNLKLANENATDEEIEKACSLAKIDEFIKSLPNGYDTLIGERGMNLSGGQRQRISVARAVLKNAPIVILDEATSSVDIENERDITKGMEHFLENKTYIIIAHRLSTIENADRIVVLKDGKIVEEGKHFELIKNHGYYYQLVLSQNEGDINEQ
jgi:ABC transporter, ATP-binding/permease protein